MSTIAGLPSTSEVIAYAHGPAWEGDAQDAALELRVRACAIPAALLIAWLAVRSGLGHFLVRTFASMWVHETGHAVAAWLCGYPAFPGPWFTPVAEQRSAILALAFGGTLALATLRAWRSERAGMGAAAAALLVFQLGCTLLLSPSRARQFIVFAGDGGCLVFGALLMATVYAPRASTIRRGGLRWGFLTIGAMSFADAFAQWWSARADEDRIPFGHNEGMGLSDPSVLTEVFGWSTHALVQRYVLLGGACFAALCIGYSIGLVRARADASPGG